MYKRLTWRYFLHYSLEGADMENVNEHPQSNLKKLSKELSFKILGSEPVTIGSCWFFLIESDSPWIGDKFPKYISYQGYPSDIDEWLDNFKYD